MKFSIPRIASGLIAASLLTTGHFTFGEDAKVQDTKPSGVDSTEADSNVAIADFSDSEVQGEYEGHIIAGGTRYPIGVRILALGEGKFRSVAYVGGLPGSGEDNSRQIVTEATRSDNGTVTFKSDRSVTVWKEGKLLAMLGDRVFEFKRVERRSPTLGKKPPKNAIALFDGKSLDEWKNGELSAQCLLPGATTKRSFGSFKMHLEFQVPLEPKKEPQSRGNSGVIIQNEFELQILDSFGLKGQHNECGGLVKIKRPDANMSSPPRAWQTFDIDFTAAEFTDTHKLLDPPLLTVRHNGVVIHRDVELPPDDSSKARRWQLSLESTGSPVLFRNIWILAD